jgi:hypothetical protein
VIALRRLYHLARADFLERVRRHSFLILLGLTVYLGYLFVPPADAAYQTVSLGNARGIYNSPWMGAMFGVTISTMVALVAFYPIKNTVTRDRETQVGGIIAATPVRGPVYVLGKWLSNMALLALLLGVMTGMGAVMQLIRAEDPGVNLWALAAPMWLIAFPTLALVAAAAVLFECIPRLRGGAGNVAYFFLFTTVLSLSVLSFGEGLAEPINDPFGIGYTISDMQRVILAYDPDYDGQFEIGGEKMTADPLLFHWPGIRWTTGMVAGRLAWVGGAVLLALAAALPFDRFDPARRRPRRRPGRGQEELSPAPAAAEALTPPKVASLSPLASRRFQPRLGAVLLAELRLTLKGCPWWWFVVAGGLIIAGLAVTNDAQRRLLQAAAWLWPVLLWSSLGNRERRHNTEGMVFSVARPVGRQILAQWLAGLCVAVVTGAGFGAQRAFTGGWGDLAAWAAGALFIPSLALALGTWTNNSRAFELVYAFLWYVGPMNRVAGLDFMGVTPQAVAGGVWAYYLMAAGALLGLALLGRWLQLRR